MGSGKCTRSVYLPLGLGGESAFLRSSYYSAIQISLLLILFCIGGPIQTTDGSTWYVSKNGANGNGTSWNTAWNEFSQVSWGSIKPGDSLIVDGGAAKMQYTSTLSIGASGSPDKKIVVCRSSQALHDGIVTVRATAASISISNCHDIKFDGIARDRLLVEGADYGFHIFNSSSCSNIEITNLTLQKARKNGIYLHNYAAGIRISGCTITLNGSGGQTDCGIYADNGQASEGNDVSGCLVYDNNQDNFMLSRGFDIHDNTIYKTSGGSSNDNIFIMNASDIRIYRNTISGITNQCIYVFAYTSGSEAASTSNILIANNILYGRSTTNDGFGVFIRSRSDGTGLTRVSGIRIYNNTIHRLSYPFFVRRTNTKETIDSVEFVNNYLFCSDPQNQYRYCVQIEDVAGSQVVAAAIRMDYNFYDFSSNSWPYVIQAAGNKYSVAIARTTSFSWELHGGSGAPMFADAGAQDFHCTDKTPYPLLNGGCDMIDLARAKPDSVALRQILVRDVDSKTRPIDLWDIGACEYQIHRAGSIGGQRGRRPDGGRTQTRRTTRAVGLAPLSPPLFTQGPAVPHVFAMDGRFSRVPRNGNTPPIASAAYIVFWSFSE